MAYRNHERSSTGDIGAWHKLRVDVVQLTQSGENPLSPDNALWQLSWVVRVIGIHAD